MRASVVRSWPLTEEEKNVLSSQLFPSLNPGDPRSWASLDDSVDRLQTAASHFAEVLWRFVQLATILGLRVIQGFSDRRRYRWENRQRDIGHHRYVRGKTPLAYSWDSIRLCVMTEAMDKRCSRFLRGYTLVDAA